MKKLLFFSAFFLFFACQNENSNDPLQIAKKRVLQKIDKAAMGMIKGFEVTDIKLVNDTTFIATHEFLNPILDKEIQITKKYFFTPDLSKITNTEEIDSKMKSQGEWIETGF